MAFTLEQLRGFLAVAEELHFGRAAARLKMTQPPLSRQIQKLERAVGAQLLERDNRRVTLTAAGEVFLGEARRLLSLADTAPDLARRVSSGSRGLVRIGFTAASTYGTLGRLLDEVERALPDIGLDLHEMVTREQVAALLNEEIDLGLARPPFDPDTFYSRLLHREALLVAVPAGHRLAGLTRDASLQQSARESADTYRSELAWREFYADVRVAQPRAGPGAGAPRAERGHLLARDDHALRASCDAKQLLDRHRAVFLRWRRPPLVPPTVPSGARGPVGPED